MATTSTTEKVKFNVGEDGIVRQTGLITLVNGRQTFVSVSCDFGSSTYGSADLIIQTETGAERWQAKYSLSWPSATLSLFEPNGVELRIGFQGARGSSANLLVLDSDTSGYSQEGLDYLITNTPPQLLPTLFDKLSARGNVCQHMEAIFAPFMPTPALVPDTNDGLTVNLPGDPLNKWRWEAIFGPDPNNEIADPRAETDLPGETLAGAPSSAVRSRRFPSLKGNVDYSIAAESFAILERLDFRVANEQDVQYLLRQQKYGSVCGRPSYDSHPLYLNVYETRKGKLDMDGFGSVGGTDSYIIIFNTSEWELNGLANRLSDGQRRLSQESVFVLAKPLDQILPVTITKRPVNSQESHDVATIGERSWEDTISGLQALLQENYRSAGSLLARQGGLSIGGAGHDADLYVKQARDKVAYIPADAAAFLKVFRF